MELLSAPGRRMALAWAAAESPPRGERRTLVVTALAAAFAVCLILASAVGALVLLRQQSARADRLSHRVVSLGAERTALGTQLVAARRLAARRYRAGAAAGQKQGFDAGYKAAFSGYDAWREGAWYVVKVGRSKNGRWFTGRVPLRPCERVYLAKGLVYRQGRAC